MPAYNAADYIAESIESVINQTYKNWELMVVDDGSTDDTAVIVDGYRNTDSRVKYLYQQNGRQGKARNLGIKNSTGKYIAFLDADDKWTPEKLSLQTEILNATPTIDLLFSQGFILNDTQVTDMNVDVKEIWARDNVADFVHHNRIPILSVLVKKEVLEQVAGFSEKTDIQNVEDYHLWLKLLLTGKQFRSIPHRLFYYRVHPGQSTYQNSNLEIPMFYAYADLFYTSTDDTGRKILMDKLKWYIFNAGFHRESQAIIIAHLNHRHKALVAYVIGKLFSKPVLSQQRIVFRLVSFFG
jgi:teichuronic acid biosynthesis glycosyltransferase TuaG